MRALVVLFFQLTLVGCDVDQRDRLCESSLRLAVLKVESSHSPNYGHQSDSAQLTENLRNLLSSCPLPDEGVSITYDYSLSVPEVYILADDMEGAARSLHSSIPTLSDLQAAQLLHSAARYGDFEILKLVVSKGVDPTLQDDVGNNAVMAVPGGHEPRVKKIEFLLNSGLRLDYRMDGDFSVVDVAVGSEDPETLVWLLDQFDPSNDEHVRLIQRSLDIAQKTESPLASILNEWLP